MNYSPAIPLLPKAIYGCAVLPANARKSISTLTARYLESGGNIKCRTPTLTEDLQRAIAKLNARQQAVYRGRVLTDPPVTRDRLARQLGIRDSTQISRIQRQAERKIAKILKRKVSP
jgi:DNA-directed RNA polymerase specialized sigma subunit